MGFRWKPFFCGFVFFVINHQCIDFGQCTNFRRERDAVWRRFFVTPIVDGRFDIGNVNTGHGNKCASINTKQRMIAGMLCFSAYENTY